MNTHSISRRQFAHLLGVGAAAAIVRPPITIVRGAASAVAPVRADPPLEVNLEGFGAVVFTSGFRPDYSRWVHFGAFDEHGFPVCDEGASTVVPGLYFVGVHFLRKRKSSLMWGVGEDAAIVARSIALR